VRLALLWFYSLLVFLLVFVFASTNILVNKDKCIKAVCDVAAIFFRYFSLLIYCGRSSRSPVFSSVGGGLPPQCNRRASNNGSLAAIIKLLFAVARKQRPYSYRRPLSNAASPR